MPLTPKEMIKKLKKAGFVHIKSNNGSHQKFYNETTNITVIVPVHAKELGKALEKVILKQAGIEE